jgi:predicted DNA-binding protein with PD1-like motif
LLKARKNSSRISKTERACDTRSSTNPKTFALILEPGGEIAAQLKQFAREQQTKGSSFKAIGACSSVKLGWFNWETRQYQTAVALNEQVELLSLIGDVAIKPDGEPQVHAHVIVGRSDGTAHGGHLLEAKVRPTCEIILTENPEHLRKEFDSQSGLFLIRP